MVANPAGFQPVFDYGAPAIISGRAREAVSGGWFVTASGVAGVISSGINSFDPTADLMFSADGSGASFTGIALHNAGSNSPISVAVNGVHIVTSAGTIVAGQVVGANGGHAVVPLLSGSAAGNIIGRALASAGSEGYTLLKLGL